MTPPRANNLSGWMGVTPAQRAGHWQAKIRVNDQLIYLGQFSDREAAARAGMETLAKLAPKK